MASYVKNVVPKTIKISLSFTLLSASATSRMFFLRFLFILTPISCVLISPDSAESYVG